MPNELHEIQQFDAVDDSKMETDPLEMSIQERIKRRETITDLAIRMEGINANLFTGVYEGFFCGWLTRAIYRLSP